MGGETTAGELLDLGDRLMMKGDMANAAIAFRRAREASSEGMGDEALRRQALAVSMRPDLSSKNALIAATALMAEAAGTEPGEKATSALKANFHQRIWTDWQDAEHLDHAIACYRGASEGEGPRSHTWIDLARCYEARALCGSAEDAEDVAKELRRTDIIAALVLRRDIITAWWPEPLSKGKIRTPSPIQAGILAECYQALGARDEAQEFLGVLKAMPNSAFEFELWRLRVDLTGVIVPHMEPVLDLPRAAKGAARLSASSGGCP